MVRLHIEDRLTSMLQDKESLRDVIAEALGVETKPVSDENGVENFGELADLFAAFGGQVHS